MSAALKGAPFTCPRTDERCGRDCALPCVVAAVQEGVKIPPSTGQVEFMALRARHLAALAVKSGADELERLARPPVSPLALGMMRQRALDGIAAYRAFLDLLGDAP